MTTLVARLRNPGSRKCLAPFHYEITGKLRNRTSFLEVAFGSLAKLENRIFYHGFTDFLILRLFVGCYFNDLNFIFDRIMVQSLLENGINHSQSKLL